MDKKKIDTKKLRAAIDQVTAVPAYNGIQGQLLSTPRHVGVDRTQLDTILEAAKTLLPPVLTYWRVETEVPAAHSGLMTWTFPTETEARDCAERKRGAVRVTGPHTWELEL